MSLVGRVGRKRLRARLAMTVLYIVLSIGAVTTLYPFAVMASTGFKGATDQNDNRLVPAFWSNVETVDGKPDPGSLYAKYLADKYAGDTSMVDSTRAMKPAGDPSTYEEFLMGLPVDYWSAGFKTAANQVTGRLALRYQAWLRDRYGSVQAVNDAYLEENTAFQAISYPAEMLDRARWHAPNSRKYKEWLEFKATLPAEFRIPVRMERMWQEYLRAKFENSFDRVPKVLIGDAKRFEEIQLNWSPTFTVKWIMTPEVHPVDYYQNLFYDTAPNRYSSISTEDLYAKFVTHAPEAKFHSSGPVKMPIEAYERAFVSGHQSEIKREFSGRNYGYMLDYMALHGRALWNTAVFCLLAIFAQLTVNPLAAYALSRYPVKASGKILIFLLATMAFPAEVAMIPSFLLLKDLGLLNTFAALVLPTAASGYMIFLLKGFFDSLPPELFESGQIDGARESTMMMKIALPLTKPVLGYLGLMAFMGAYGAFLYAFLVAQDQRIWTLMVFIYQLQSTAPKAVIMAALTLAALPTVLVFLFAQRAIMRGIILPGEK